MSILYRKYKNYKEYIKHQSSKIDKLIKKKNIWTRKVRPECFNKEVRKFMPKVEMIKEYIRGSSILCLGARVGIEVVALRKLGFSKAVGIDINPGKNNKYVIKGDFHNIPFEDNSFDTAYSNCIDHIFDIRKFSKESSRILTNKGRLILEISHILDFNDKNNNLLITLPKDKKYESFICDNFEDIKINFKEFELIVYKEVKDRRILAVFENKR